MSESREMPKYQSHKQVWALQIQTIEADHLTDGGHIIPKDEGYGPVPVSGEYLRKHKPQPGGYYVVYPDGYKSFSPAQAFESGYTRI